MTVTGSNTNLTYSLNSGAEGDFKFGAITIGGSGTALGGAVEVVAQGNLTNTALASIFVAGSEVAINDANSHDPFSIAISGTKVGTIYDINNNASITKVGGAQYLITSESGTFTFGSSILNGSTGTQIFSIANDKDGVTFTIDNSGTVIGISGIDAGATVAISDTTFTQAKYGRAKTFDAAGTWSRDSVTGWDIDKYIGYIIGYASGTTTFHVTGIESTTDQAHVTVDDYSKLGKSDSSLFTVNKNIFDSTTQVIFQNNGTNKYSAQLSGTSITTSIFSNLDVTGAGLGVLLESGETVALSLANVPSGKGTATAITSLNDVGSSTFDLKLGAYGLNVYGDYNVIGNGVGVSVDSSLVTGAATVESAATIAMPDGAPIGFGSTTGIYNINGLTTQTLTIDATKGSAVGTNSSVFELGLTEGAVVTDTFTLNASELKINDLTYKLATGESSTFTFASSSDGTDSGTLTVSAGFVQRNQLWRGQ